MAILTIHNNEGDTLEHYDQVIRSDEIQSKEVRR